MSYDEAKSKYAAIGVDTDAVLEIMSMFPISLDLCAGESDPRALMRDLDLVLSLCPGYKKLILHPRYAVFSKETGGPVDRNLLRPEHFKPWADFCSERGIGADFTPDFGNHPMCDPLTLSSPNKSVRRFWIDHAKASLRISQYLAERLGDPCVMSIVAHDGFKDFPADLLGPRARYRHSLDEILSEHFDINLVKPCIEPGSIYAGDEKYMVASDDFCISYAATNRERCLPLVTAGYQNSAESASNRISALLAFFDEIAVHVSHPAQSHSDSVVLFDDETREVMTELVRNDAICRVHIALDFSAASSGRLASLIASYRNAQKAMLYAMLMPNAGLKALQDRGSFAEMMVVREQIKTMPFGDVWDAYCLSCGVPCEGEWFPTVQNYEKEVLTSHRFTL